MWPRPPKPKWIPIMTENSALIFPHCYCCNMKQFFAQLLFGRVFRFGAVQLSVFRVFPCVLRFTVLLDGAVVVYVHFGRIFSGRVATATVVVLVHFTCTRNHFHCLCGEIKKDRTRKTNWKNVCGHGQYRMKWKGIPNCLLLPSLADNV